MRAPALLVAAAIVAGGCAQSPPEPETVAGNAAGSGAEEPVAAAEAGETYTNEERVCERVRRTGSHRSQIICRTRAEIEQEATESKRTFDSLRNDQMNTTEYGRQ